MKIAAIGRQNESGFLLCGSGAITQRNERGRDFAPGTGLDMNIPTLQDTAHIGLIGLTSFQAFDRCSLVAKSFQKSIRKRIRLKRLLCQQGYGFFDFYSVHYAGLVVLRFY